MSEHFDFEVRKTHHTEYCQRQGTEGPEDQKRGGGEGLGLKWRLLQFQLMLSPDLSWSFMRTSHMRYHLMVV
jgi:hypothetical protein